MTEIAADVTVPYRVSQPAICSGDHCRRSQVDTVRLRNGRQASLQSLGRRALSQADRTGQLDSGPPRHYDGLHG
jgi:hypothetical protein